MAELKCFRITAISKMGFSGKGKRFPFPNRNRTFKSEKDARRAIKQIQKANKGTYNIRMLFGKPRVERC